jgi:hypothetical protein
MDRCQRITVCCYEIGTRPQNRRSHSRSDTAEWTLDIYFFISALDNQDSGICTICYEPFTDYNDVVPDHKEPKGMGGAWRDDHPDERHPNF